MEKEEMMELITEMRNQMRKLTKRVEGYGVRIDAIDPATYEDIRKKHKQLSDLYQSLFSRYTAISEILVYMCHQDTDPQDALDVARGILDACDRDNDWWSDKADKPLHKLAKMFKETGRCLAA